MIALDTSAKLGKSPKRQKVEEIVKNDNQDEESNVEEDSDNDDESSNENNDENEVNDEENESDNADESNDDDDDDDAKEESDNGDEENSIADDADDENVQSGDSDDESKATGNAGWADVMQKILKTNKPKKKKTLVLSRAKKISEIVPKVIDDKSTVDIVNKDGQIKTEIKDEKNAVAVPVVENKLKRKKKDPNLTARVKPSVLDKDREKTLQKIATKGVVQLFNAVKQQQTEIHNKIIDAGPLERKREKALKNIDKNAFLDVLMGGTKSIKVDNTITATKKEEDVEKKAENVWSVLRDDFVMGANLKDWDKNAPEDDDSSAPEEMDSD